MALGIESFNTSYRTVATIHFDVKTISCHHTCKKSLGQRDLGAQTKHMANRGGIQDMQNAGKKGLRSLFLEAHSLLASRSSDVTKFEERLKGGSRIETKQSPIRASRDNHRWAAHGDPDLLRWKKCF